MFNTENQTPAWQTELIETTLELTNVGFKIRIRDQNSRKYWWVNPVFAYALLTSSFKDKTRRQPLTDVAPAALLKEEGQTITLAGAFPHRQLFMQQCGFKYFLDRNENLENDSLRDNSGRFLFFVCNQNFPVEWCAEVYEMYGKAIA
ncbi:MAG TPA: hypothetical protein V6C69_01535 [Trichormus sp.]|jgi:hypothetical protein